MSLVNFKTNTHQPEVIDVSLQLMTLKKMFCEQKRDGKIITGKRKKAMDEDKAVDDMVFSDESKSDDDNNIEVIIPKSRSEVEGVDVQGEL